MPPLVSVVIPAHNVAPYLPACLASLRAQDCSWQAIVADDASTDATPHIARSAADADPRIGVISLPRRSGVSAARNAAMGLAAGDWLLFLDADDLLEPGALPAMLDTAARTGADAVFGAYHVCDARARTLYTYTDARPRVTLDDLFDRAYLWTAAHILRRDRLDRPRPIRFDPALTGYEDRDVWLRLAEAGLTWATTPTPVARYRIRPGSASKNPAAMLRDAQHVVTACFARQSALPPAQRRLACDPPRLARALDHLALAYATRQAILDPAAGPAQAAALWSTHGGHATPLPSPADAARAAQYALIYALGRWPDPDPTAEWARACARFWSALTPDPAWRHTATAALATPLRPGAKPIPARATA